VHYSSCSCAASVVLLHWQRGTCIVALFKRAARQHAAFLACKSLQAWQRATRIQASKLRLLQQVRSFHNAGLRARAFRAWLVCCAQRMQQELAVQAAVEQLQDRMLARVFWNWHVLLQHERARLLQHMHAAVVFRDTFMQQAAFGSWQQWVWIRSFGFQLSAFDLSAPCNFVDPASLSAECAAQTSGHAAPFCSSCTSKLIAEEMPCGVVRLHKIQSSAQTRAFPPCRSCPCQASDPADRTLLARMERTTRAAQDSVLGVAAGC
jgi:hypothetical protein